MRFATLIIVMFIASPGRAQDSTSSALPKEYTAFQGDWTVASLQRGNSTADSPPREIFVTVTGMNFKMSGPGAPSSWKEPLEFRIPQSQQDNPYRTVLERGSKNVADIVDVPNQIEVFWFVGLYRLVDNELHLALKYCGQGVEGKYAREFRPPTSFDQKAKDDEIRVVLKRKKK